MHPQQEYLPMVSCSRNTKKQADYLNNICYEHRKIKNTEEENAICIISEIGNGDHTHWEKKQIIWQVERIGQAHHNNTSPRSELNARPQHCAERHHGLGKHLEGRCGEQLAVFSGLGILLLGGRMLWEGLLEVEPDCQSQIPMVAGEGLWVWLQNF